MGIRSDVIVCVRSDLVLPEEIRTWMDRDCDESHTCEEGTLWSFTNVKWYNPEDPSIAGLYSALRAHNTDDAYLVLEACHDYPGSDENCVGAWYNNPWNASREVVARVHFDVD